MGFNVPFSYSLANPMFEEEQQQPRDRLRNPYWLEEDLDMKLLKTSTLSTDETTFWWELIEEYLKVSNWRMTNQNPD